MCGAMDVDIALQLIGNQSLSDSGCPGNTLMYLLPCHMSVKLVLLLLVHEKRDNMPSP